MRAHIQFITCEIVNLHIKCRHRPIIQIIIIINPTLAYVFPWLFFALVLRFFSRFSIVLHISAADRTQVSTHMYDEGDCCANRNRCICIDRKCNSCGCSSGSGSVYLVVNYTQFENAFSHFCWIYLRKRLTRADETKTFNACVDSNDTQLHIWMFRTRCA